MPGMGHLERLDSAAADAFEASGPQRPRVVARSK